MFIRNFVSPKSRYMPKVIYCAAVFIWLRNIMNGLSRTEFKTAQENFHLFPQELQQALINNDPRYLKAASH